MSENSDIYDFGAKVLLVGDPGVGKTYLAAQFSRSPWLKRTGFRHDCKTFFPQILTFHKKVFPMFQEQLKQMEKR